MAILYQLRPVLVAAVTVRGGKTRRVADLASDFTAASVIQREVVNPEQGWDPGFRRVAVFTLSPEKPQVDLRFSMALSTKRRYASEALVDMTPFAGELRMPAFKGEDFIMIKSLHSVDAIVAAEARGSELIDVVPDESRAFSCVAGTAAFLGELADVDAMAVLTGDPPPIEIESVVFQGKMGRHLMGKGRTAEGGRQPG
ncbi:MAG TPA: hypothetical protein VJ768_03110 [Anaerolineales bacterium]|nr:hypothetical protein [Anaerolineales bacterium]